MDGRELDARLDERRPEGDRLLKVLLGAVAVVDEEAEGAAEVEGLGLALGPAVEALRERLGREREGVRVVAGREGVVRELEGLVRLRGRLGQLGEGVCGGRATRG